MADQDALSGFKADLGRMLVAHANAIPQRRSAPSRRRRAARGGALTGVALTLAAGIAAVAVIVLTASTVSGGPPAADAAVVLRTAANSILRQPSNALGPGQYWYTKSVATWSGPRRIFRDQEWVGRDGAGVDRSLVGGRRELQITRLPSSARPFIFGQGAVSYAQLRALPTDMAALGARLDELAAGQQRALIRKDEWGPLRGAGGRAFVLFTLIRSAFEDPTSPALRAALYRLAASLPGVRLDGPLHDHAGRRGVGISVGLGTLERFRIVINPGTGQLLETQRILMHRSEQFYPGVPAGLYMRYTVVVNRVVDGAPSLKPAG